jgi:hypothetical protein
VENNNIGKLIFTKVEQNGLGGALDIAIFYV